MYDLTAEPLFDFIERLRLNVKQAFLDKAAQFSHTFLSGKLSIGIQQNLIKDYKLEATAKVVKYSVTQQNSISSPNKNPSRFSKHQRCQRTPSDNKTNHPM